MLIIIQISLYLQICNPRSSCGLGLAVIILLTEGYTNVSSLKGGFGSWVEAGFPVAEYAAP
jgi:hypothetical protein